MGRPSVWRAIGQVVNSHHRGSAHTVWAMDHFVSVSVRVLTHLHRASACMKAQNQLAIDTRQKARVATVVS